MASCSYLRAKIQQNVFLTLENVCVKATLAQNQQQIKNAQNQTPVAAEVSPQKTDRNTKKCKNDETTLPSMISSSLSGIYSCFGAWVVSYI